MFAANGSIFTILAISFERYYAICKPLKAGYKCTRLRATIIICLIWLLSTLLTLPILIMAKSSETSYIDGSLVYNCILETDLSWHKWYVFISFFAFFCLPLLVLMLVYWLISRRLIRENIAMLGDNHHHQQQRGSFATTTTTATLSNQLLASGGGGGGGAKSAAWPNGHVCQHQQAASSRSAPPSGRQRAATKFKSIRSALLAPIQQRSGRAPQRRPDELEARPTGQPTDESEQRTDGQTAAKCTVTTSCPPASAEARCRRHRPFANKSLSLDHHHHHHIKLSMTTGETSLTGRDARADDELGNANSSGTSKQRCSQQSGELPTAASEIKLEQRPASGARRMFSTCRYLVARLAGRLTWTHSTSARIVERENFNEYHSGRGHGPASHHETDSQAISEMNNRRSSARPVGDDVERDMHSAREPFLSCQGEHCAPGSTAGRASDSEGTGQTTQVDLGPRPQRVEDDLRMRRDSARNSKDLPQQARLASLVTSSNSGQGLGFRFKWAKGFSVSSSTGDSSIYTNSTCLTDPRRSASPMDLDSSVILNSNPNVVDYDEPVGGGEHDAKGPISNERLAIKQCHSIETTGSGSDTSRTHLVAPIKQQRRRRPDNGKWSPQLGDASRRRQASMRVEPSIDERAGGQSMSRSPSSHSINYLKCSSTSSSPDSELFQKCSLSRKRETSAGELAQVRSSSTSPASSDLVSSSDSAAAAALALSAGAGDRSPDVNTSNYNADRRAFDCSSSGRQQHPAADVGSGERHSSPAHCLSSKPARNKPTRGISFKLSEQDEETSGLDNLINLDEGSRIRANREHDSEPSRRPSETPGLASGGRGAEQQAQSGRRRSREVNSIPGRHEPTRVAGQPTHADSSSARSHPEPPNGDRVRSSVEAVAVDEADRASNRLADKAVVVVGVSEQHERQKQHHQHKRQSLKGSLDGFAKLNLVSMANATFQQNLRRFSRRSGSQPLVCSACHFHCQSAEHNRCQMANGHYHHDHHHHHQKTASPNGRLASELLVVRDISKKQQMDSRRQVVMMLAFVVACFFLLFFPYRVFTIWLIMSTEDQVQSLGMETYYNLTYFSRILIYLHSAINPIAYNLISTKFRRAFMSILLCRGPATRRHFTTEPHYFHHHHHHHQHQQPANQRLIGQPHHNHQQQQQYLNSSQSNSNSSASAASKPNRNSNKKRSLQIT